METVIEVKHASKKIKEVQILTDVNLDIQKGKIYGIIGRNGSGKTVLFCKLASGSEQIQNL